MLSFARTATFARARTACHETAESRIIEARSSRENAEASKPQYGHGRSSTHVQSFRSGAIGMPRSYGADLRAPGDFLFGGRHARMERAVQGSRLGSVGHRVNRFDG